MLTDQQHPITPPPELVQQWWATATYDPYGADLLNLATQAARWGADQELEACCEWADATGWYGAGDMLRAARRPKPLSLAKEALGLLVEGPVSELLDNEVATIRRALERLQELEEGNE